MFTGPGLGREAFSMGRCGVTTSEFMKCLTFQQYVQERGVADIETLNVLQRMETHSVMTTLATSNQAKITKYFKR